VVSGADAQGFYVFTTANSSGQGLATSFTVPQAPLGSFYLQLVGDTQASVLMGRGECTSTADCPGDVDVLQTASFQVAPNNDGFGQNPAPSATLVTVSQAGESVALPDIAYLGSLVIDDTALRAAAPADPAACWRRSATPTTPSATTWRCSTSPRWAARRRPRPPPTGCTRTARSSPGTLRRGARRGDAVRGGHRRRRRQRLPPRRRHRRPD
jgi:hypothetical protein